MKRALVILACGFLAACEQPPLPASAPRPVQTVLAVPATLSDVLRVTGDIQAQTSADLGFRNGGKVVERLVDIGQRVEAGQVLARLDASNEENALKAAQAGETAATGEVEQTRIAYGRQAELLRQGFTTRPRYEQALTAYERARARLDDARAQVALATDRVGFTVLRADAPGTVIFRALEAGEVVAPGQVVLRLARDEGRDAVFDVASRILDRGAPESGLFTIALASDPGVTARGRVREVAPAADAVTGTFRVRIGLDRPPAAMVLGAPVIGNVEKRTANAISLPAGALVTRQGEPAVWVVDPATSQVSLRNIEVMRFEAAEVIVSQGLAPGERVVSAGTQVLYPGQKVEPLPARQGSVSDNANKTAAPG
jgi:RND family efflux transporter MFP subunit